MVFPIDVLNARPSRQATIRTRRSVDEVALIVREIGSRPRPGGVTRLFARGHFTGTPVAEREFEMTYHYNSLRNPQSYAIRCRIEDDGDWRVVDVAIRARSAWLGGWTFALLAVYLGFYGYAQGDSLAHVAKAGFVVLAVTVGIIALANVVYIPGLVAETVTHDLAHQLHGSVLEGGHWVVPRSEAPRSD